VDSHEPQNCPFRDSPVKKKRPTMFSILCGGATWQNRVQIGVRRITNFLSILRNKRACRIWPWSASRTSVKRKFREITRSEVIDIAKFPGLSKDHQIVATPAVFRTLPAPLKKSIGDLSQKDKALLGLDLFTPLKSRRPRGKNASKVRLPQAAD